MRFPTSKTGYGCGLIAEDYGDSLKAYGVIDGSYYTTGAFRSFFCGMDDNSGSLVWLCDTCAHKYFVW